MKKIISAICSIVMASIMLMGFTSTAFAAGTVATPDVSIQPISDGDVHILPVPDGDVHILPVPDGDVHILPVPDEPVRIQPVDPVRIQIDGVILKDAEPIVCNGRTLLPLRKVAEYLGYNVLWIPETRGIQMYRDDDVILMWLDNPDLVIGGTVYEELFDVVPFAVDGTTYIPVRGLFEKLGYAVDYNAAERLVIINTLFHAL